MANKPIRVVKMNIDALKSIDIGRTTENHAMMVEINLSRWLQIWPDAVPVLWLMRPGENVRYPALTTLDGSILRWLITDYDTEIAGTGRMEVSFQRGEDFALSASAVVTVTQRIGKKDGVSGDPEPDWSKNVIARTSAEADRAEEAADRAQKIVDEFNPGTGSGGAGEDGGYYIPSVDDEGLLSWQPSKDDMPAVDPANVKGPKGDPGNPGEPGPAGYTPEKGKDYWTEDDKEEIKGYIDESVSNLPSGGGVSTLKRVASVIVGADETYKEIEITGLNLTVPFTVVAGTRGKRGEWAPGGGIIIALNGQGKTAFRGSINDARAWFFDIDGKIECDYMLEWNASYRGKFAWNYSSDTTITSIKITNPYASNVNNADYYFGNGFFVEVWDGVFPNIPNVVDM